MPTEESIKFSFTSTAQPDDTFMVAEFTGKEAISKLYEFEITLYADDPDIDLKEVLKNPVKLTVEKEGEQLRVFHGILSRFEQLHEYSGHVYFRAILVPRLWIADQYLENQLFLDKSIPDIIEEVLKQTGLTTNDYEMKLTGSYDPWEYICQYNESDFNFISRWMEREGIYYYFEQGSEAEKLVIADASTAHQDITSGESIRYSPPDSLAPSTTEQVREFTCHQQLLPKKIVLKDYNYRKPSLSLKGEADVDPEGRGNVYIYGEHFKTPEQGNALATIRAEELLCREALFYGEGTVPPFLTGYVFELHDHYRDSYNQRYLIIELSHKGVQSTYLTGAGGESTDDSQGPSYFNNFSCIPADTQFRPERLAEKPKLKGTLNGTVDASGDGEYAEIDDEGRYKVKLPFDQSDSADGKASRWMRMSQPYAGADYGMHFPLHKGTEVLLTFIDGDPDRPIISGTVPNPETGSPVTGGNQTQSMIRTAGGNQIRIEDSAGGQQIHMSSPTENSIISLGDVNAGNVYLATDGTQVTVCKKGSFEDVGEDKTIKIKGKEWKYVTGNRKLDVIGEERTNAMQYREVRVGDQENRYVANGQQNYITNSRKTQIISGGDEYIVTAGGRTHNVTGGETYNVIGNRTISVSGNHTGHSDGVCIASYVGHTMARYLSTSMTAHAGLNYEASASAGIEISAGLKYFASFSIDIGYSAGLKLVKESACIKTGLSDIQESSGPAVKKSLVHLFI